ncbi:MAG: hypothetical protein FWB75_08395 [Oscillospiraceae bacterium]|nr:hypothetical protein [Oscillospiraceae bacterium]
MTDMRLFGCVKRKIIVTGHYGSGKTEFSVSLAMLHAGHVGEKLALVDLDIVNPYFRARERREMLEAAGVKLYGDHFDTAITAEIPALGANVRIPLEDSSCRVIIDAGGNDAGALVLNQFTKYFTDDDTTVLAVVNACRPDTADVQGVLAHIASIESATGLKITQLVNNTHLLTETTAQMIHRGFELCTQVCNQTGIELLCSCYPKNTVDPMELSGISGFLVPMGLYMQTSWLDNR